AASSRHGLKATTDHRCRCSADRAMSDHHPDCYIGQPLRRREDVRFVRGEGRYVDDVLPPRTAWCCFVRSPHASARIRSINTARAAALPSTLLVLTAADWEAAGHGELTVVHPMPFGDGRPMNEAPRPAFARDKVRSEEHTSELQSHL